MVIRKRFLFTQLPVCIPILSASRYSEFDDLRTKLLLTFPNSNAAMPPLPPKSLICESRPVLLPSSSADLDKISSALIFWRNAESVWPTF